MNCLEGFKAIVTSPSETEFKAIPVSTERRDYLAKTLSGAPVFLLHDAGPYHFTPGIQLKNLRVQYHVKCKVQTEHEQYEGTFALVACNPDAPELYEIFLQCVGLSIESLPDFATSQIIDSCIQSLLTLFRNLNNSNGRAISGLWAELYLISCAENIPHAVEAWHIDAYERYDFSWPTTLLEVKSAQGEHRIHEFNLSQLEVLPGRRGYIVSFLLLPLSSGIGVMELAAQINSHLSKHPALRERLWINIAEALGSEFCTKLDQRYDVTYAQQNLIIFDMHDIPSPERPTDPRVTSVRFRADLSAVVSTYSQPTFKGLRTIYRNML